MLKLSSRKGHGWTYNPGSSLETLLLKEQIQESVIGR